MEFVVFSNLWQAEVLVLYLVQLLGIELLMEFIGDDDGIVAPCLV